MFVMVEMMLAKYLVLGVVPVAVPTIMSLNQQSARENPEAGRHRLTPIISYLAGRVGAVFYLDPGPTPAAAMAYWGPDISKMFSGVQPAAEHPISMPRAMSTRFNFSFDGTQAKTTLITIIEPNSKVPIPIPIRASTRCAPRMPRMRRPRSSSSRFKPIASEDPIGAALVDWASCFESADVVSASGQLDVLRYGHIFKARQVAAVRVPGSTMTASIT